MPLHASAPGPFSAPASDGLLRLELGNLDARMTRTEGGSRAALALASAYRGERTIVIGFAGVHAVRGGALARLLTQACWLLDPWQDEARLELRGLRPAVRRTLLLWLASCRELVVVSAARRALVVAPVAWRALRRHAELRLSANRRRMLLLAARDGERCVWCSTALTHRSPEATLDHVRCRSAGGANALENLVLSCAGCNHARSNAPAPEWLERCLALGLAVDVDAVEAAIRRAELDHRQRARRHVTRGTALRLAA